MTAHPIADQLSALAREAETQAAQARDAATLEAWRVQFLGRRGRLTQAMGKLGTLGPEERRVAGAEANRATNWMKVEYPTAC